MFLLPEKSHGYGTALLSNAQKPSVPVFQSILHLVFKRSFKRIWICLSLVMLMWFFYLVKHLTKDHIQKPMAMKNESEDPKMHTSNYKNKTIIKSNAVSTLVFCDALWERAPRECMFIMTFGLFCVTDNLNKYSAKITNCILR